MKHIKTFESLDKVKSIHVSTHELDEYDQPVLNIETENGRKYYLNLKSWSDFDENED